ncbi:hypothetical protein D2T30_20390 [Sinirhodobacter populi]|uniref:Uncharacterized protein n=1 Tax=Paenirhodobacter populi TaxID=2306993 RepID=A0A443J8Y2_9RHOB|nr:hypothetical protein D2T30_20390 [Sinirhodobacter populi]
MAALLTSPQRPLDTAIRPLTALSNIFRFGCRWFYRIAMPYFELPSAIFLGWSSWTVGPLDRWTVGPLDRWTVGPLDRWTVGPLDRWTVGPLDRWTVGRTLSARGDHSQVLKKAARLRQAPHIM